MDATSLSEAPAAIVRCEPKRSRDLVANLRDSSIFSDFQDSFQKITGLPLVLRPVGAFQSPLVGAKNASAAVAILSKCNRSSAAYLRFQGEIEEASLAGAHTRECEFGLLETLVPICTGHTVVAFLQTGHAVYRKVKRSQVEHLANGWREDGQAFPADEFYSALLAAPVVEKAKYVAAIALVRIFAGHLSIVANQVAVSQTKAELPAVARARVFIEQHQTEEISLGDVAKAVNMSAFYFCKVFRKVTGVTFIEYLARMRTERVKELLLNPHIRVSEAAFAAGFQSLSQFNRVFLRIAGESPTVYRDRLHGVALVAQAHVA